MLRTDRQTVPALEIVTEGGSASQKDTKTAIITPTKTLTKAISVKKFSPPALYNKKSMSMVTLQARVLMFNCTRAFGQKATNPEALGKATRTTTTKN